MFATDFIQSVCECCYILVNIWAQILTILEAGRSALSSQTRLNNRLKLVARRILSLRGCSALSSQTRPGTRSYSFARRIAKALVSRILVSNNFLKFDTRSSGGPCSMISLIFVVRPMDRSPARDLGRDSMTYTISHLIVSLHRCGKNQYATMPGSAVVPCIEYSGTAGAGINGSCFRCTLTYLLGSFGSS